MAELRQNFLYPEIKKTDYHFGSKQVLGTIIRPNGDWRDALPPEESQKRNNVESSACAVESQQHAIATIQEAQHDLPNQNYSARFNLMFGGANPSGSDPLRVAQSFRDEGLIPDYMLPFSDSIKSWNDFCSFFGGNKNECIAEGQVWRSKWEPRYDIVFEKQHALEYKYIKLRQALMYSPVPVSVYGVEDGRGSYMPKPVGVDDTHMVECVYVDGNNCAYVFDTYHPYLKKLPANYNFDFGMRWSVEKRTKAQQQISLITRLLYWLRELLKVTPA